MPATAAAATKFVFGESDCKLDNVMLGHLAQMCSPDLPVNNTTMIGDFAFSEICVNETEATSLKALLNAVRSPIQADLIADLAEELAQKSKKLGQVGKAVEEEFVRLCKIFFLRSRSMTVTRVSTGEVIGRIISFPDQISDDYGNNLEPRCEKGMNPTKIAQAERAEEFKGKTLFLGHGQGATMAQVCACLCGAQCIVFDGTLLSEILSQNVFREKLPEPFKVEKADEEREWNIIFQSLDIVEARSAVGAPEAIEVAQQLVAQRAIAREAEEEDTQKADCNKSSPKKGESNIFAPNKKPQQEGEEEEEDDGLTNAEKAESFFAKRECYMISGIPPKGPTSRFEVNGKFTASGLSDMLAAPMTRVAVSKYPFAIPQEEEEEDDE